MSKMAAPSSLWCLGSYFILLALDIVICDRVSKLHVPHLTPPDSVIITISSLGDTPSLVNQQEISGIFDLTNSEFKSKGDLSGFLGGTFDIIIKSDVHTSEQHHLLVKVDNSSELFSFSHHQYFASVQENSARHTKLDVIGDLFVKCDTDVSLRFVSGTGDKFYVKRHKKGAKQCVEIYTNGPLDREKKDTYSLLLQAKSKGGKIAQTVIHVYIQDENDEIPKFNQTKYTTNIPTSLLVGSSVLKVQAIDKDIGTVSYHLEGTTDFSINSMSGDIVLSSSSYSVKDHKFKVVATDQGGLKSSANVQINILSGNLKFIPHHHLSKRAVNRLERSFEIFENEGKSKPLFSIASQLTPSTGVEQYHLIDSTVDLFQVDTRGNVYVKEGHTLDYEEVSHRSIIMNFNITNTNSQTGPNGLCGSVKKDLYNSTQQNMTFTVHDKKGTATITLLVTSARKAEKGACHGNELNCENDFCIPGNLACNGYNNCGNGIDELTCVLALAVGVIIAIVIGAILAIACLTTVIICVVCRPRHRRRYRQI